MNIILVGLPGSGKSTQGKKLARTLKWNFIDTDHLIHGGNCRQLFQTVGEKEFRRIEYEALLSLEGVFESVIAVGGGALELEESALFLKRLGKIVYLKIDPRRALQRVFRKGVPAYATDAQAFLALAEKRQALYERYADMSIDNQEKIWQVIHLEQCFASPPGESRMGLL